MLWKPGQSGNPKGRKPGTPDRRTQYRALFEQNAPALVEKAIALALEGDTTALKMCLERIASPLRAREEAIELGELKGPLPARGEKVLEAMGAGELTPTEAGQVLGALGRQAQLQVIADLEERIRKLEASNDPSN